MLILPVHTTTCQVRTEIAMSQHHQQQQDDSYVHAQLNSHYQVPYNNYNNTACQLPPQHGQAQSSPYGHDHSSNIPNNFTQGASPQYAQSLPAHPYAQVSSAQSYTNISPARYPSPSQYPTALPYYQAHRQALDTSASHQLSHWTYHTPIASAYPLGAPVNTPSHTAASSIYTPALSNTNYLDPSVSTRTNSLAP